MSAGKIVITKVYEDGGLPEQMAPHMGALGNAIGSRMQRIVPKRTWALHDSITVETVATKTAVTTTITAGGLRAGHWVHVEYGTRRMAAQPYMRPALAQSRSADLGFPGTVKRHGVVEILSRRERMQRASARRKGGAS